MFIELFYKEEGDIPSGYDKLYTKKEDGWHLTGVKGVKTQADIDGVKESLRKERDKVKELEGKLKDAKTPEEIEDLEQQIEDLEKRVKDGGGEDEEAIQARIDKAVERAEKPLNRQIETLTTEVATQTERGDKATTSLDARDIESGARKVFSGLKVLSGAMPDALMHAASALSIDEDGVITTKDGDTLENYAAELVESRKDIWLERVGGGGANPGGGGGGGKSPFSKDGWSKTGQGEFVTKYGAERAAEEAKKYGSTLGATKPPA